MMHIYIYFLFSWYVLYLFIPNVQNNYNKKKKLYSIFCNISALTVNELKMEINENF